MNPAERDLVERTLELAEENNKILRYLRSSQRWSNVWGFIRLAIFIIPLIIGYFYLQPYLGTMEQLYKQAQAILSTGIQMPR